MIYYLYPYSRDKYNISDYYYIFGDRAILIVNLFELDYCLYIPF